MKGDVYFIQKRFKFINTRIMLVVSGVNDDMVNMEYIDYISLPIDLFNKHRKCSHQQFKELIRNLTSDSDYNYKINGKKMLSMLSGNTDYINMTLVLDLYNNSDYYSDLINTNFEKLHKEIQEELINKIL